jgi:Tfp pilus assembly protein PilX
MKNSHNKFLRPGKNEQGFALVTALLVLVVLTLIGFSAMNTTTFELQIAGNEKNATDRFFAADSGWKQAGAWLNSHASAPEFYNLLNPIATPATDSMGYSTDVFVRNFGGDAYLALEPPFAANTEDGKINNTQSIPYWYRVVYINDEAAVNFGTGYRSFRYFAESYADNTANISTRLSRVFKVGY